MSDWDGMFAQKIFGGYWANIFSLEERFQTIEQLQPIWKMWLD